MQLVKVIGQVVASYKDPNLTGQKLLLVQPLDSDRKPVGRVSEPKARYADEINTEEFLKILEQEMAEAAEAMDFERAAILRDQVFELRAADR